MKLFITGGTGFIGRAVLAQIAEKIEQRNEESERFTTIYVLIRADSDEVAQKRLKSLADALFPTDTKHNMRAIRGDLLSKKLIDCPDQHQELCDNLTHILHIGASTDFGSPIEEARACNVRGTEKILDLANACRNNVRFDYVSTAFVAGRDRGTVSENDLDRNQKFSNSYEQSKYEAEIIVSEFARRTPTVIYRPSIVVGDSTTGFTLHFKVLYWPLRLLEKPFLKFCMINRFHKMDVVPVDFVARAIAHTLTDDQAIGKTLHLTCGRGAEVSMQRVLKDAQQYAELPKKLVLPFWIKPLFHLRVFRKLMSGDLKNVLELAAPYEFYFRGIRVRFSNRETLQYLEKFALQPPHWSNYAPIVMSFCRLSVWGRKLPKPSFQYYQNLRLTKSLTKNGENK